MFYKSPAHPAPIQFRPSERLADWIGQHSKAWQVTANEAARRLTALAISCLDLDYFHAKLEALAEANTCGRGTKLDFLHACEQIKFAVDFIGKARADMGMEPFTLEQRLQYIQRTVDELIEDKNGQYLESKAGSPWAVAHPGLPQIRTCPIQASGSSGQSFACATVH